MGKFSQDENKQFHFRKQNETRSKQKLKKKKTNQIAAVWKRYFILEINESHN